MPPPAMRRAVPGRNDAMDFIGVLLWSIRSRLGRRKVDAERLAGARDVLGACLRRTHELAQGSLQWPHLCVGLVRRRPMQTPRSRAQATHACDRSKARSQDETRQNSGCNRQSAMELNPHLPQKAQPVSEELAERVRETVEAVYRSESRRVFATLIRLLGDFDLAEEALHDAFRAALEQWPRDGVPANPRAWLVSAGRFKAIDGMRRRARFDALEDRRRASRRDAPTRRRAVGRREHRGRPAAADLHLLPPGAGAGRAGGAHAARSLRPHDRRDRAGVPDRRADAGAAHRAREGEDPRRAHSLPGAGAGRAAGAAGQRAARDLPGVQRGLLGVVGRVADAASICRARRSAWGGCWSSCCRSPRRSDCWR